MVPGSQGSKEFFRYLPVSKRDEQWGLYVTAGGFNSIEPDAPYPRPGHPSGYAFSWSKGRVLSEFQALYITRGEGEFESKSSPRQTVVAGSVILLFPGVWHRYRPRIEQGWDEYWISFNGPWIERIVEHQFFSPENPILTTGLNDLLLHDYVSFLDRLRSEPVGFQQLLAASAMEILAAMLGARRGQGTGGHLHDLIRQAKAVLETQSAIPSMEELAASLGLSATHFHRLFKEHTGLTPYQYHLQLRIERARHMLQGAGMTIKEIASSLSFESPFHFSHAFKRKIGMSPSLWRKQGLSPDRDDESSAS
jgi:AraC-like DNA-binding protein